MDPFVRPNNSNGPDEPRRRATRSGRRSETTEPRKTSASGRRTRTQTAAVTPEREGQVTAEAEAAAYLAPDAAAVTEAGPVVGIEDFEEIFTRFQTPLTNFVFRLVGNREQAYDLTQDVFVKAYRALSSGTTIQAAALSSWLYRIASNTATDALRRRRLISWLPLSLFNEDRGVGAGMPGGDGASQQGIAEDALSAAASTFVSSYDGGRFEQRVADREIVESVLRRLPPKYATCLLLYEHEGFSCAEIAEVLNVSPSAVKMRLMRARERFITLYQQEMGGH
jgi:RNA polymerase sigma-70 factor (ECF subfamily)